MGEIRPPTPIEARPERQWSKRRRRFELLIRDEGPGFTPDRYFSVEESRLFDSHGRGILFARSALDVEYLGRGNEVRVTLS